MASDADESVGETLTVTERQRLDDIRSAETLAALQSVTETGSLHDAYFAAKETWDSLRGRELDAAPGGTGTVPGATVVVDGHAFQVHGVTHADTDAERSFLRTAVRDWIDDGAVVYCEQGIRPMYFGDVGGVCAMDDYRWATQQCRTFDDRRSGGFDRSEFGTVLEDVTGLAARFRESAFSLIDAGSDVYGEDVEDALGEVASAFLQDHEGVATGEDFESFKRSQAAARDPATHLRGLQCHYERTFLPQPLEREWLRRHDPELELVTHARNERMADYAVYHNDVAEEIHLIVGAAHGPGVRYYLEAHRDGRRHVDEFELA
jgi:hypothetical protein